MAEVAITEGEEEKRERFQASLQSDLLTVCIAFQDFIVADVAITEGGGGEEGKVSGNPAL